MELIIMFFVSMAPFIFSFQSLLQNHWIITFMVESDQKDNLVQTHIQASVSSTTSPTHSHTTDLSTPVISFPPQYTISDPYVKKSKIFTCVILFALKLIAKFLTKQSCKLMGRAREQGNKGTLWNSVRQKILTWKLTLQTLESLEYKSVGC